jgi:hypothetical protein
VRYRSRRVGVAKSDEVGILGEAVNEVRPLHRSWPTL